MRKKIIGLLILLLIYVLAFVVGAISFILLKEYVPLMLNLFISDVIATIFVWIIGIFLKTASIYDPYWSVQTVVIYISLMVMFDNYNIGTLLYLSFIMFWAVRLTYNFIKGFNDLSYIDWRYKNIKEKTKSMYQMVSLLGIHLVPTIIVFLASVPSFLYVINNNKFEAINIIGLSIMLLATIIEMIADNNMHTFKSIRKSNKEIINVGLWKYSRHPNYLGEIAFWYGVSFVYIFSNFNQYYTIIGAILNTLLFVFISIPMAENNLAKYKENFIEYKKRTRMLLPIKKPLSKNINKI